MQNNSFSKYKYAGFAALAVSAITLSACGSGSSDGAAVFQAYVDELNATGVMTAQFGEIVENGSEIEVRDFEITINSEQIGTTISEFLGAEFVMGEADVSVDAVVTYPSLVFDNLSDQETRYAADAVRADTLELAYTIVAPLGNGSEQTQNNTTTYSGISATNLDWAKLPAIEHNEQQPVSQFFPVLRAVIDFSFDEMVIESTTAETRAQPGNMTSTVQGETIRYGQTLRGDISELSQGAMTMEMGLSNPEDAQQEIMLTLEAGESTATDYNIGTLFETLLGLGEEPSADYQTAIGAAQLNTLSVSVPSENITASMGSLVMENIGVRTPQTNWVELADAAAVAALAGEVFDDMSEEEMVRTILGVYGAFSLGKVEVTDIEFSAPNENVSGELASFGITDLSSEGLGSYYITGMDMTGPEGGFIKLGEVSVSGIGFPQLDALIAFEQNLALGNTPEMLKAIPTMEKLTYSGVDVSIPEEELDFAVGLMEVTMGGHIGPIPTEIGIDMDNVRFPIDELEPEPRMMVQGLGYEEHIELSHGLNLEWDEDTQDVNVAFDAGLVDGGEVAGTATIGGVPRIVFEQPDQTALISLLGTTFKNLEVQYDDDSLVDRGFEFAAQQNGTDAATMKAQIQAMMPLVLTQLGDAELASTLAEAVTNVIENGDSISLSAVASSPLPMTALGFAMQTNPASVLQQLDIEVSN